MSPPCGTSLLSPSPPHPEPLFELSEMYRKFLLAIYFTYGNVGFYVMNFVKVVSVEGQKQDRQNWIEDENMDTTR